MRYIYKTVMLNQFAHSEAGKKYLAKGLSLDINEKIGEMIQALLNHYAKDGWEYWRNDTFAPMFFQSISSMLFNIVPDSAAPPIPVFIFRKEFTEEIQRQLEEEQKRELEELAMRKAKNSEGADSKCPKCNSLVRMSDEFCWSCNASFWKEGAKRPKPI